MPSAYFELRRPREFIFRVCVDCTKSLTYQSYVLSLGYLGFRYFGLQFAGDILLVLPGKRDIFGMTATCDNLVILVDELHRGESQRLANYLRVSETTTGEQNSLTFITNNLAPDKIAEFPA